MAESTKSATLTIDGNSFELPIYSPSAGPDVMDIRKLFSQANVFTYDPGFTSTAACDSTITFIDGDEGVLLHRGYPIDQLASESHYLEVCYLLLYGELPSAAQLEEFENLVTNHTMIHEQMINFFRGFRREVRRSVSELQCHCPIPLLDFQAAATCIHPGGPSSFLRYSLYGNGEVGFTQVNVFP